MSDVTSELSTSLPSSSSASAKGPGTAGVPSLSGCVQGRPDGSYGVEVASVLVRVTWSR